MIKTKEDLALERLKGTLLAEGYWQDVLEDFAIIETALNKYYRLLKEDNETTKKLKALEVIRKVFHSSTTYTYKLEDSLECGWITQEEYDLLKEVLL